MSTVPAARVPTARAPAGRTPRGPAPRPRGTAYDVVELACRAPSLHNSQPWLWRVRPAPGTRRARGGWWVELYADRARQDHEADPAGRSLVLSCGAALHHLQVAAVALGWEPTPSRLPDPTRPDLLARVHLAEAPASADDPDAAADLRALRERRTDRRRFTSWPVPTERLEHLADVARAWHCPAVPVVDAVSRFRVELLVATALEDLGRDPRRPPVATELVESADGVLVLAGDSDDALAWLRAGEALSALWLRAGRDGLAVVPLSQPLELERTRASLEHDVLAGRGVPLLLARVGWQEISRDSAPATPRRPLAEVLVP